MFQSVFKDQTLQEEGKNCYLFKFADPDDSFFLGLKLKLKIKRENFYFSLIFNFKFYN